MNKILVILGPTATGKTDLAIILAKKFNGELVACDSRQVYKGLDIGTGKLPGYRTEFIKEQGYWQIDKVKVWMYDVVDLNKQYTVADYVEDAGKVIEGIILRKKLPIIVGGTGLYLKALLEGFSNLDIPVDEALRGKLINLSLAELQAKLKELSISRWEKLNESDKKNPRRLLRSIELVTMNPYIKTRKIDSIIQDADILKIGLTAPRELLYKNINLRAKKWIEEGIIKEVKDLIKSGISKERIKTLGLEYQIVVDYLNNEYSLELLIEQMQTKTRQYAKRQITWFKKEKNISWFYITEKNYPIEMENMIAKWYDSLRIYASEN